MLKNKKKKKKKKSKKNDIKIIYKCINLEKTETGLEKKRILRKIEKNFF